MLKLIFFLLTASLCASSAMCQNSVSAITGKTVFKRPATHISAITPATTVQRTISPTMLVSPSFYTDNLPFFCRQEYKFEKATKINFKFRLGSVQYVDYLEGKKGATRY